MPDITVGADTLPTFLLQAENDAVDGVTQSLACYIALKEAGMPTDMPLYAQGGPCFGMRASKLSVAQWPHLVETCGGTSACWTQPARAERSALAGSC